MSDDRVPQPQSSSKVIQIVANQSWYGSCGVSQPAAQTPQEAIARDPRKSPTDPTLKGA